MRDPYRARILPTVSLDPLWRAIERKRKIQRSVPLGMLAGVAISIAAIAATGLSSGRVPGHSEASRLKRSIVNPRAEPWGFEISAHEIRAWSGPLPVGVHRPGPEATDTPAAVLQLALFEQAGDRIRACYRDSVSSEATAGELVVDVASRDGRNESAVSGPRALREQVGACVRRAIDGVHFPLAPHDVAWFHVPIRFAPGARASARLR